MHTLFDGEQLILLNQLKRIQKNYEISDFEHSQYSKNIENILKFKVSKSFKNIGNHSKNI